MRIYRVVVEWPNRTNPLDRILSELFESEEAARQYLKGVREDQQLDAKFEREIRHWFGE